MISEKNSSLGRTTKLKENLLSSKYELCVERMRFFTEIYKKYPDKPEIIKRAKCQICYYWRHCLPAAWLCPGYDGHRHIYRT